jgi:ABC-type multidrug transport system ATPase subunit
MSYLSISFAPPQNAKTSSSAGVMAEGELRCCGSPLFLKRRFGSGYTLVITRKSSCVLRALQDVVLQIVPSATLMSAVGTEVMFQLPMDAVSSFPALLDTLGTEQLGVEQFGISITTMEEVFCKIASGESQANNDAMLHDVSERQETEPHAGSDAAAAGAVSPPSSMFVQHVHAMFTKRCQYGHRDRVAILCTTVLPVIMLLVGLVLLKYGESGGIFANQVSTPMNLDKCTDQAVTPVPFIVGSDRSDAHPAVSAKVEARLSQMPGSMPEKMPYSGATAEGSQHLWGVNYEAGIPECGYAYHPRSDVPWTDRRFNYIGWPLELMDPELIVGFAQSVLTAGAGSDDAVAYGALIFHDELDQRPVDICSIPAVVSEPHSAVVSGNSDGAKCSVSIRAPPGQTVHLKILRNTLRTNTVSLYNATQPLPTNLMAVLSVNSTDQIVRSSTGTITIVENQEHPISTAGCAGCEEWSVLWSFQDACADSNEQCPVIVDQVASLGFDCHSTLGDINIDTIPFPPVDVRTGEPIVLPRNPVTGKEVTEPEFRLLAHQYMPRLIRQYGDNTLAEFCPVSCVDEVCINDRNNNCVRKNQCEQQGQASCHYSSSAIKPPQFACSTEELQTVATTCGNGWRDTGFCKSRCFGQLKPWLVHCEQQRQAAMAGLSWTSWGVLNAAMGLAPNCDARPFVSSDTSSSSSNPQVGVTIMVNSSAYHAAPTYMNIASNVLRKGPLHHDVDDHTQTAGASIIMNSYPLPFTQKQSALLDSIKALQAVLFIMIAFAFVPGGIVVYVVREKEQHHNSKHQQMISGASIPSFWLASFAYDVLVYCLPLCLSLLAILWVDLRALIEDGAFFACFMLLLGYGLAITSFTYCCSFLFDKHTKAQIVTVLFNVFLGMVLMVAQFIMAQIDATQPMNESLMPVYRLSPGFCLGHGLLTLTTSNLLTTYLGQSVIYEPLSAEIAGTDVLYLFVLTVIYLLLAIAIEYARSKPKIAAWFAPRSLRAVEDAPYSVDEDVQAEADRIERSAPGSADELIRLVNLRKVYRGSFRSAPKVAVRNMSFGVNTGECFGYLGINGAGKTTTMKILTGELLATSGQAYLGGLDITEHQQRVRHLIGYCPQFDALLDKLTTLEHLQLFGRLKGLQGLALEEAIAGILRMLGLTNFTNKLAGTLSGGNKRKLSVGIALIGRPRVIFLDEPSTGVDPVARRFMWGVISTVCKDPVHPCCVVLTSHVMEEIEALCTRVGVVVGGRLRCLGSNQHLKARFGRGYCLELKLKRPAAAAVAAVLRDPCLAARAGAPVLGGELGAVCAALGRGARAALVSPEDEGGWVIHEALQREGCVALPELARWWLGEDAVEQLDAFIQQRCPAARRIERQGSMLSYLVGDGVGAPELFRVAEATRHECGVEEYGVAQDTLEHIFNSFAAQQQEEGGSVRGMATPDRDGASAAGPSHNEVEHGSDPTCTSTANPVASNPSDGQAVLVAEDL